MSDDALGLSTFNRLFHQREHPRSPEWEMLFPGFTYRLWRVSEVDVDETGFKWVWEARLAGRAPEVFAAESKTEAEGLLRRRIQSDLGPLVGGLGRYVQHERDWCYACGRTLPTVEAIQAASSP